MCAFSICAFDSEVCSFGTFPKISQSSHFLFVSRFPFPDRRLHTFPIPHIFLSRKRDLAICPALPVREHSRVPNSNFIFLFPLIAFQPVIWLVHCVGGRSHHVFHCAHTRLLKNAPARGRFSITKKKDSKTTISRVALVN